jgi:hypothetical protein
MRRLWIGMSLTRRLLEALVEQWKDRTIIEESGNEGFRPSDISGGTAGNRAMAAFSKMRQVLATADRHIAEGAAQIAPQAKLIRELTADGHDATSAQNLLMFIPPPADHVKVVTCCS